APARSQGSSRSPAACWCRVSASAQAWTWAGSCASQSSKRARSLAVQSAASSRATQVAAWSKWRFVGVLRMFTLSAVHVHVEGIAAQFPAQPLQGAGDLLFHGLGGDAAVARDLAVAHAADAVEQVGLAATLGQLQQCLAQ